MSLSAFSSRHSSQAAEKLAELHRSFQDNGHKNGKPADKNVEADVPPLVDLLYRRAPDDFLQRTSLETLKHISKEMEGFLGDFLQSGEMFIAREVSLDGLEEEESVTGIAVAMIDRPFIVDTFSEFFRELDVRVYTYLHPIVDCPDDKVVSLGYIELERIVSIERRNDILKNITSLCADIVPVTDGFPTMVQRLKECIAEIQRSNSNSNISDVERDETADFLRWLADGGFVFLGYRRWDVEIGKGNDSSAEIMPDLSQDLGLFQSANPVFQEGLDETLNDAKNLLRKDSIMSLARTLMVSPVHRRLQMKLISIKSASEDGSKEHVHCFLGLLTSRAVAQESSSIPFVRQKLKRLINLEGVKPNSHDYKEIVSIVDSMPKSELLQSSVESLQRDISLIMNLRQTQETRISLVLDEMRRAITLMVVMPRERFSAAVRQKIRDYIERELHVPAGCSEFRLAVADDPLVRLYFFLPNPARSDVSLNTDKLEERISELSLSWDDNLRVALELRFGRGSADRLLAFYRRALPEQYKAATSPQEAAFDISKLEDLNSEKEIDVALRASDDDAHCADFRIYKKRGGLTLSAIIPLLENANLEIIDERATSISTQDSTWAAIYNFRIAKKSGEVFDLSQDTTLFLEGMRAVFEGQANNDRLNSLLVDPGMDVKDLAILRIAQRYLWQLKTFSSARSVIRSIVSNPNIAKILVSYFRTKFDPDLFDGKACEERSAKLQEIEDQFLLELKSVRDLLQDRVLRAVLDVFQATVRTNFFQNEGTAIGLKIRCKDVREMPEPRPFFETFVSSPAFEGVHLRGGKVARGGLRWSERPEDYRTEILGLMKTQVVKNSIIIPVGAKGGFIVKGDASKENVAACYRQFIRTLLQLADNRVDDEVVHPTRTVVFDEEDPYLVVAADKGTATFSDIANEIAIKEFDFWLGDAFASGGKNGYDHKKLGITARGAWEAVCRHFREIGIDVENKEFSVTGIGDMSGDVFGNGLLLNDNALLIAAFNHKHVFVDPTPDSKISFNERKRLFKLPHSNWTDYNSELISEGGGIFERSAKEIPITPQMKQALGIDEDVLSGQELIRCVLRAPVDLIWNGGIGTYVKASIESNMSVEDPSNDDVRVDAKELRVKIVGEGGNLGFTQQARIEYSKLGGHINTDAVDNSGGVDCSDLEVNLKILLNAAVRKGKLSNDERNELLESCSGAVCRKVTSRNRSQSKILSLGVRRSRHNIDYYRGLISTLEQSDGLNRDNEFLPDDEELIRRSQLKAGLTRPELAIIIAYVKLSLFETIMKSNLPEEAFLQRYLFGYFPSDIVNRFHEETIEHPLRREIIATQVANELVERMGASFVYRTAHQTGTNQVEIISAFLTADQLLRADELKLQLRNLDKPDTTSTHLKALLTVTASLDSMTRWLLHNHPKELKWSELLSRFDAPFGELLGQTEQLVSDLELRRYHEALNQLEVNGFPQELARAIASISYCTSYLDAVAISTDLDANVVEIARLYTQLASEFQVTNLLEQASDIEPVDRWESLAIRSTVAELKSSIALITRSVLQEMGNPSLDSMEEYLNRRSETIQRYRQNMREFHNRSMTIPALLVFSNQLRGLSRSRQSSSISKS